jgi:hypothetical protein
MSLADNVPVLSLFLAASALDAITAPFRSVLPVICISKPPEDVAIENGIND